MKSETKPTTRSVSFSVTPAPSVAVELTSVSSRYVSSWSEDVLEWEERSPSIVSALRSLAGSSRWLAKSSVMTMGGSVVSQCS